MTTMAFISMVVALILVIIAIARIQGSPKLGINLLLTLAFAIVVGFGIQSKTKHFTKKDTIEKVSEVNHELIQALPIIGVTPVIIAINRSVGKVKYDLQKKQESQQLLLTYYPVNDQINSDYEDSS